MKRSVKIRPRAVADAEDARDWYEARVQGLGDDFLNELSVSLDGVAENPEQQRVYYRGFRRALVRRFPFKIFYRLIEDRVVVFRILHGKQDHPKRLLP